MGHRYETNLEDWVRLEEIRKFKKVSSLNDDVWGEIIGFLTLQERTRLRGTCKRFKGVVEIVSSHDRYYFRWEIRLPNTILLISQMRSYFFSEKEKTVWVKRIIYRYDELIKLDKSGKYKSWGGSSREGLFTLRRLGDFVNESRPTEIINLLGGHP